jgi:hypothetical protein
MVGRSYHVLVFSEPSPRKIPASEGSRISSIDQ